MQRSASVMSLNLQSERPVPEILHRKTWWPRMWCSLGLSPGKLGFY